MITPSALPASSGYMPHFDARRAFALGAVLIHPVLSSMSLPRRDDAHLRGA